MELFDKIYNECIPIVNKKHKITSLNKKPWITPALITSAKQKNNLYSIWMKTKKTKSEADLNKYKLSENKFIKIMKLSKKQYYSDCFQKLEGDIKGTWHLLKNIMNKNHNPDSINEILVNGVKITDPNQIADNFNDFFVNVGPNLAKKQIM